MAQSPKVESPNSCDMCSGKALLPDHEIPLLQVPCAEAALNASQLSPGECVVTLTSGYDASSVCCENTEAPNTCKVCSEQYQLIPSRTVSSQLYGQVTCKDFEEAASLVVSEEMCQSLQHEAATTCCMDLSKSESSQCELRCPDGSIPVDLSKRDPVTGYTCSDLVYAYSRFPDNGQDCQNSTASTIGFDGVAFCCPALNPPKECSTCPSGQELLYPDRILFLYQEHSCRTLDESLAYVVGKTACEQILADSRAENNCLCRPLRRQTIPPLPLPEELNREVSSPSASIDGMWDILVLLLVGVQSFWAFDYL
jgi:hypothetical protein